MHNRASRCPGIHLLFSKLIACAHEHPHQIHQVNAASWLRGRGTELENTALEDFILSSCSALCPPLALPSIVENRSYIFEYWGLPGLTRPALFIRVTRSKFYLYTPTGKGDPSSQIHTSKLSPERHPLLLSSSLHCWHTHLAVKGSIRAPMPGYDFFASP